MYNNEGEQKAIDDDANWLELVSQLRNIGNCEHRGEGH